MCRFIKSKCIRFLLKVLAVLFGLFVVTFTVYFFNLDMKLTAKIEPILLKHYDKIKRSNYI